MRPVNLIPADQRRGGPRSAKAGVGGYLVIGGLLAVLAGVTAVVITGNQISERKADIASLQQQEQAAQARADSLRSFADFATIQQARTATVSNLATSRFDWERVLRELALVIPDGITLKSLSGTASSAVTLEGETASTLRGEIPGPALAMAGCAPGQDAVAELITALEDIDGVTRVGLEDSTNADPQGSAAAAGGGGAIDCPTGTKFQLVAAFDAAPIPSATPTAPVVPTPPPSSDGGVTEAAQQQANSATDVQQSAQQAEDLVRTNSGR